MGAESDQNEEEMLPKWDKAPPKTPFAEQERKGEEFNAKKDHQPSPFGPRFGSKSMKNAVPNLFENQSRKCMDKYAKSLPKQMPNRCQNASNNNAQSYNKEGRANREQSCFLQG